MRRKAVTGKQVDIRQNRKWKNEITTTTKRVNSAGQEDPELNIERKMKKVTGKRRQGKKG